MPSRRDVVTFHDPPVPDGASPYVPGAGPQPGIDVVDPDPAWPGHYAQLERLVREALGFRVLSLEHVGSTAVPGLPAKPIIDMDLLVADPDDEDAYVPALVEAGFELRVREPWWFGHRVLRTLRPGSNLHVFGLDSPEPVKHRIFRDWLRIDADDRAHYARAKRDAAAAANAAGEHSMQYNARKEQVVREIYQRAFAAAGLLDG
jgi:GrpB-like predicted nucleotidyltransferase (UPF0157 family)